MYSRVYVAVDHYTGPAKLHKCGGLTTLTLYVDKPAMHYAVFNVCVVAVVMVWW